MASRPSLWLVAGLLGVILAGVALSLPSDLGRAKASKSFGGLFARSRAINLMAAARTFLFGSRDVWFVVGLPVFLYGQGWGCMDVAGCVASWTIGYGLVQAVAPSVIRRSGDGLSREVPKARLWGAILAISSRRPHGRSEQFRRDRGQALWLGSAPSVPRTSSGAP